MIFGHLAEAPVTSVISTSSFDACRDLGRSNNAWACTRVHVCSVKVGVWSRCGWVCVAECVDCGMSGAWVHVWAELREGTLAESRMKGAKNSAKQSKWPPKQTVLKADSLIKLNFLLHAKLFNENEMLYLGTDVSFLHFKSEWKLQQQTFLITCYPFFGTCKHVFDNLQVFLILSKKKNSEKKLIRTICERFCAILSRLLGQPSSVMS